MALNSDSAFTKLLWSLFICRYEPSITVNVHCDCGRAGEIATRKRAWSLTGATRRKPTSLIRNVQYCAMKTRTNSSTPAQPDSRNCTHSPPVAHRATRCTMMCGDRFQSAVSRALGGMRTLGVQGGHFRHYEHRLP